MRARVAVDLAVTHGRAVLSVEDGGSWMGAVRLADLLEVPDEKRDELRVADLVRPVELLLSSDVSVGEGQRRMAEEGVTVAAVVSHETPVRIVGLVTLRGLRAMGRNE